VGGKCVATYAVVSSWPGGFQASVTIADNGTSAINGWTIKWTYPGDQKISQMWSASYTQSGGQVSATNLSYDATIAPGSSVNFGFTGTYASSNASPTSFTVNGAGCP
jgi:cellulase/cellobiase CelA1